VELPTSAATRHVVTAQMIEEAHRQQPLKGVLLMSPANPTGAMMTGEEIAQVCALCDKLGLAFISDEIYHGLTYAAPAKTALQFSNEAIVVNSFSKYYCMTGWRVGWLVLPERLVRTVERLQQSLAISTPYLSQVAACAAFDARPELEAIKAGYARNRDLLIEAFPKIGLGDFVAPDGAFYIYADVGAFTNDSLDFSRRMLREAGVAATTGLDFDRQRGARFMRFSYAGAEADIAEAIARLKNWLPKQSECAS
jgi:aspartate/methionine/tyrosine aminotransferase